MEETSASRGYELLGRQHAPRSHSRNRERAADQTHDRFRQRFWALLAGALLAGIKIATVARQLGVSRSWASREANAAGTCLAIAELLAPHRERLSRLFDKTLDVIEDAFQARKMFLVKGAFVDSGPDHYARNAAVKLFMLIVSSRR